MGSPSLHKRGIFQTSSERKWMRDHWMSYWILTISTCIDLCYFRMRHPLFSIPRKDILWCDRGLADLAVRLILPDLLNEKGAKIGRARKMMRLVVLIMGAPSKILLLLAPVDVLCHRKREDPPDEIQTLCQGYVALHEACLLPTVKIDANREVLLVEQQVQKVVSEISMDDVSLLASALSTIVLFNSIGGLVFWLVVGLRFTTIEIGIAALALSASMLMATVCALNLNQGLVHCLTRSKRPQNMWFFATTIQIAILSLVCGFFSVITSSWSFSWIPSEWSEISTPNLFGGVFLLAAATIISLNRDASAAAWGREEYIPIRSLLNNIIRITAVIILPSHTGLNVLWAAAIGMTGAALMPQWLKHTPSKATKRLIDVFHIGHISWWQGLFYSLPGLLLPWIASSRVSIEVAGVILVAWTLVNLPWQVAGSVANAQMRGSHLDMRTRRENAFAIGTRILILPTIILAILDTRLLSLLGHEASLIPQGTIFLVLLATPLILMGRVGMIPLITSANPLRAVMTQFVASAAFLGALFALPFNHGLVIGAWVWAAIAAVAWHMSKSITINSKTETEGSECE